MNRERVQAIKRVLDRYRFDGIPDDYLARIIAPLVGTGVDASELDRLIGQDFERGVVRLAENIAALPTND